MANTSWNGTSPFILPLRLVCTARKKWNLHTIFTFGCNAFECAIEGLYNIADVQNIKQPNHKSSQTLNAFVNMTISSSLFVWVQNVHLTPRFVYKTFTPPPPPPKNNYSNCLFE